MSVTDIAPRQDLSPTELAAYSGIKGSTLAAWRKRGEGPPYFQLGRTVRYPRAEFDRWVEQQTRAS